MWVRKSSIRKVPPYARVETASLDSVRRSLFAESEDIQQLLDEAYEAFDSKQPVVASHVGDVLGRRLGEATTALGFYLSLTVWMAFEHAHGGKMRRVSEGEMRSTRELFLLDQDIRREEESEVVETEDIVRMEQPALVDFVHEHMNRTVEMTEQKVDASELALVYRMVLMEILALSYAVVPPVGYPSLRSEIQA